MGLKKLIDLDLLDRFLNKVKELIPTKTSDLTNDAGFMVGMTILSYGSSTWSDFIAAYDEKKVVYCRASSGSDPASGSQTRLAFMAYVNNAATPTEVEFQYYRSVNSHTDAQQGDQVYVYKLNKNSGWSVTVRNAFSKVATGTGLSHTYSNGTITIDSTVEVPTKVSDLQNDSGFITGITSADVTTALGYTPPTQDTTYESKTAASGGTDVSLVTTGEKYTWNNKGTYSKPSGGIPVSDLASGVIPTVPTAYTSNPAMDGTASPGSSGSWAKGDHVHPTDTSRQAKIAASGILKGDGSGGVSAAVAGTDYLTPATNYSPISHLAPGTTRTITSADNGKTFVDSYSSTASTLDILFTLSQSDSSAFPVGAEIALTRIYSKSTKLTVSGVRLFSADNGIIGSASGTATVQISQRGMAAIKKIESNTATYGDVWLLTGNVEVST